MTYPVPIEFQYHTSCKKLENGIKENLSLPPKTIIRIFGTAGSGKGTISSRLSDFFAIPTLDSGKIWRAVAYGYSLTNLENTKENTRIIMQNVALQPNIEARNFDIFYCNQLLQDKDLRNPQIDGTVSLYSVHREAYNEYIINFLRNNSSSLVLDGRGGKTPYLIDAENHGYTLIRVFLFCTVDEAARRRTLDYLAANPEEDKESLLATTINKLTERDMNDYSHIVQQNMGWVDDDTFALDTTNLTIDEVFETVLYQIHEQLEAN